MNLGFDGRRVVVVGGSYGIGYATAAMLMKEGAEVLIASRSTSNLEDAATRLEAETGRRPAVLAVDVTQSGAGDQLADAVERLWGSLDVLITAVGGSVRAEFADLSDDDWLQNYAFNVLSTVRSIRGLLRLLEKGTSPAVVMLGAAAARMPYAHQIMSNVHKAGLLGLSKTLASELAPAGIRVNTVGPGRTLTPLWINRADGIAAERGTTREAVIEEFSREIPLNRFATPEEVAVVVVWLASPLASYITGQSINADGGIARGLL